MLIAARKDCVSPNIQLSGRALRSVVDKTEIELWPLLLEKVKLREKWIEGEWSCTGSPASIERRPLRSPPEYQVQGKQESFQTGEGWSAEDLVECKPPDRWPIRSGAIIESLEVRAVSTLGVCSCLRLLPFLSLAL